jgi:hypothetical protein
MISDSKTQQQQQRVDSCNSNGNVGNENSTLPPAPMFNSNGNTALSSKIGNKPKAKNPYKWIMEEFEDKNLDKVKRTLLVALDDISKGYSKLEQNKSSSSLKRKYIINCSIIDRRSRSVSTTRTPYYQHQAYQATGTQIHNHYQTQHQQPTHHFNPNNETNENWPLTSANNGSNGNLPYYLHGQQANAGVGIASMMHQSKSIESILNESNAG